MINSRLTLRIGRWHSILASLGYSYHHLSFSDSFSWNLFIQAAGMETKL